MTSQIPLVLFAKAPIPGQVKTRLQTHCSPQQAARIASYLMEASIKTVTAHWPGSVYLSVWLDHEHAFFKAMQARYRVAMLRQCEGDLGEKMQHALHGLGYPAAVMGCDAPHTKPHTLTEAYSLMHSGRSVIGPSEDGGYYLLGLSEPADSLFLGKSWGGDQVLKQTLLSADNYGLPITQLDPLNDVDEWSDLLAVVDQLDDLRDYLFAENLID